MDTIKTEGKWTFTLERGGEKVERTINNPYTVGLDNENTQDAVNAAYEYFTSSTDRKNKIIQPTNWRDENDSEEEWTTTNVRYDIIVTQTRPIEYDPS